MKRVYERRPITLVGEERMDMSGITGKQMASGLKPGDRVDSCFSVAYKKPVAEYRNGYMFEVRVADRTGQLTVKYWGDRDQAAVQHLYSSFDKDDVVRVVGAASEYKSQTEVSVSKENGGSITRVPEGMYDRSEFVPSVDDLPGKRERLLSLVGKVDEPHMRALLESFFGDSGFMDRFSTAPASIQMHSAAVGGLIHHTLNVAELALEVVRQHPELDKDIVLTGALLHDIGKVMTFEVTTRIDHTPEGNLLGEVVLGDELLAAHIAGIEGFPENLAVKLRHIILSHHGRMDWGAPVEPMTPEALAVHKADDVDAKVEYMIVKRRDALTEDDWIWDGRLRRRIYLR
ncbi:MAG: 3'-5' exoribonuclease YhaM family protein [Thermoplasmata archaeon]